MAKLKTKFSLVLVLISTLIITSVATVLIASEKQQILSDIIVETYNFAELSKSKFQDAITNFLLTEQTVSFESAKNSLLLKNSNIEKMQIYSFIGEQIFSDSTQALKPELERIKSSVSSLKLSDGSIAYVNNQTDTLSFQNRNGQTLKAPKPAQIINWVVPLPPDFALVFDVNYTSLQQRINQALASLIFLFTIIAGLSVVLAFFFAGRLTRPIRLLTDAVLKIAEGDLNQKVRFKSSDEVGQLSSSVNKMAKDLKAATKAKIYQARVSKELELASKIQNDLLPKSIPEFENLDIHASIIPASEVGGDIFDVLKTETENLIYLGDVTGHGVPASLISAISSALMLNNLDQKDMLELSKRINHVLHQKTPSNMFITLLMMRFEKNKLHYLSAGHEQIVRYQSKADQVDLLPSGGIALGLFPILPASMQVQQYTLSKNDVIITYSDGIPEAFDHKGKQYGMQRLQDSLKRLSSQANATAKTIHDGILEEVNKFRSGYEQKDDISLMVIKKI